MLNKIAIGFIAIFAVALTSCGNPVDSAQSEMKSALGKMVGIVKSGAEKIKGASASSEISAFINQTTDESKKCIEEYNMAIEKNKLSPEQQAKAEDGLKEMIGEKIKVIGEFQTAIGESIIRLSNNQVGIAEVQSALENSKILLNF